MSADGAALQRLPPSVARFRIWTDPTSAPLSADRRVGRPDAGVALERPRGDRGADPETGAVRRARAAGADSRRTGRPRTRPGAWRSSAAGGGRSRPPPRWRPGRARPASGRTPPRSSASRGQTVARVSPWGCRLGAASPPTILPDGGDGERLVRGPDAATCHKVTRILPRRTIGHALVRGASDRRSGEERSRATQRPKKASTPSARAGACRRPSRRRVSSPACRARYTLINPATEAPLREVAYTSAVGARRHRRASPRGPARLAPVPVARARAPSWARWCPRSAPWPTRSRSTSPARWASRSSRPGTRSTTHDRPGGDHVPAGGSRAGRRAAPAQGRGSSGSSATSRWGSCSTSRPGTTRS